MSLDINELEPTTRNDYRRANGAPMVMVNGKSERYSRPSSFAKPLDDESALVNWKMDRVAFGVARDRALQARWCAVNDSDRETKSKLREDSIAAGRGAERADIGTALHAMSVRFEQELDFSPPQPYLESLEAYMAEMNRLNLSTARSEFHTVNREYRCAGTADRLYEVCSPLVTPDGEILPVGTLLVGDLKTGEKLEYSKPAYAVQLFLYADGEFYDVVLDDFITTPPINKRWGIIVHMPAEEPGRCEFLWCDLEVGRFGAYIVSQVKLWRKMWRSGEYDLPPLQLHDEGETRAWNDGAPPWSEAHEPPEGGLQNRVETVTTILDEPVVDGAVEPDDDRLAGHVEWIKQRLTQIGGHSGARAALTIRWPEGLPTPKQGIETIEQAEAIHALLDMIEADYELGFVPRPASIQTTGPAHKKGRR